MSMPIVTSSRDTGVTVRQREGMITVQALW
jgi:hypothetical protein